MVAACAGIAAARTPAASHAAIAFESAAFAAYRFPWGLAVDAAPTIVGGGFYAGPIGWPAGITAMSLQGTLS